jgi:hypothetical protein
MGRSEGSQDSADERGGNIVDLDVFVTDDLIVESGHDADQRPIFAFYLCRFPNPSTTDTNLEDLLQYSNSFGWSLPA